MIQKAYSLIKRPAYKTAGIYTFSNFFAKGTSFLLLFIYSNPIYLSVHENGLLNLLSSSVFILMPFLSLGIVQSTSVDFFKLKGDEFKNFFTTGFVMPLCIMFLAFGCLFAFSSNLKKAYDFPLSFALIIPILTFLNFCNEQFLSLLRNNDEPVVYLKASMLRLFLEISISLTLVVAFSYHWHGRVAGIMLASITLAIVSINYFKKKGYLFGCVKKKYLKQEMNYALPIIIMQCSTFCLFSSDKFFLSYFSNNEQVGIYSYACVFAAVITLLSSALLSFILPKIYKNLSEKQINYNQIKKLFVFYTLANFVLLIIVVSVTPFLYRFFINKSYSPGLQYLYLIAVGYFFWTITYFFYSFMLYKKHKRKILYLSLISIIISLSFNYFFIKDGNAKEAALSVCLSYLVVMLVTLIASYENIVAIFFEKK